MYLCKLSCQFIWIIIFSNNNIVWFTIPYFYCYSQNVFLIVWPLQMWLIKTTLPFNTNRLLLFLSLRMIPLITTIINIGLILGVLPIGTRSRNFSLRIHEHLKVSILSIKSATIIELWFIKIIVLWNSGVCCFLLLGNLICCVWVVWFVVGSSITILRW
jgi:hypothetical protein